MKKFLFLGFCGLLAAGITSCREESFGDSSLTPDVGGETGYLSFRIKSADTGGMTRAWNDQDDDFHIGDAATGDFADESAVVDNIQANRVFFFTEDGTYHSSSLLSLSEVADGGHQGDDTHSEDYGGKEKVYSTMVKRTGERDDALYDWPTQCLVVLNGRPSRLNAILLKAQADPSFNLEQFLTWINEDFRDTDAAGEGETLGLYKYTGGDGKYYFTMSNSVFYSGDGTTLYNATQIPQDKMKSTSEEAAKEENLITVYVERIISKVEVNFDKYDGVTGDGGSFGDDDVPPYGFIYSFTNADGSPSYEEDSKWLDGEHGENINEEYATTIKLKALITNWTINAVEYQTKLFKDVNFTTKSTGAYIEPTYGENNPFAGWNDYNHHRSYWANDVNYFWDEDKYPVQYRAAFDQDRNSYQDDSFRVWEYGTPTKEESGNDIFNASYPWALDYKAYNAITNRKKYKYCLENTFAPEAGKNYHHMIMGSHLLVQSRLIDGDEETKIKAQITSSTTNLESALDGLIKDKYYYNDRYYDENLYIRRQVAIINELLGETVGKSTVKNMKMWTTDADGNDATFDFENINGGLWVKEGDTYKRVTVNKTADEGEIAATDVFGIAPAYVSKGDGKVTIALKGNKNGFGYDSEKINLYYNVNSVAEGNQPDAPVQLTRNKLVALIYGMTNIADCFKNGRMYYAVPIQHHLAAGTGQNYKYEFDNVAVGDYGMVRNHWYKFTINNVLKPGVPVHDTAQPIIPNYDDKDRYIGLQVVILPWHIVDNGKVTLGN